MFYLLGRRAGGSCVQRRRSKSGQKVSPQFSELSPHLGILWKAVAKILLTKGEAIPELHPIVSGLGLLCPTLRPLPPCSATPCCSPSKTRRPVTTCPPPTSQDTSSVRSTSEPRPCLGGLHPRQVITTIAHP